MNRKSVFTAILCMAFSGIISCSVHMNPHPATQRLTFKYQYKLGINLEKITEIEQVRGSACVWGFTFGSKAYDLYLKEAIKNASEYSLIDYFDSVETIVPGNSTAGYLVVFTPAITDFKISPFLNTTFTMNAVFTDNTGNILFSREIKASSKNSSSSCALGFMGNVFAQSFAIEMSVNSAVEDAYRQLYASMLESFILKKDDQSVEEPAKDAEKTESVSAIQTILLKDGSRIVGRIVSQTKSEVTIQTKYTIIKVSKEKIELIKYK